jgi:hypothetical protein
MVSKWEIDSLKEFIHKRLKDINKESLREDIKKDA